MNRNMRALRGYLSNYVRNDFDNPFYASFKITHRCNLRCGFCNVWADKIPDLKTSDVFTVIDNLSRASTFTISFEAVSYTHLRAHETDSYLVCRLLLEKKKNIQIL